MTVTGRSELVGATVSGGLEWEVVVVTVSVVRICKFFNKASEDFMFLSPA